MADETTEVLDPRKKAMYSIHLPANVTRSAARELKFPSGVKKRMNKDQTDKNAEDYPHFQFAITHAQAADLASNGYEVRLLKKSPPAEPAAEGGAESSGPAINTEAQRARARKKG